MGRRKEGMRGAMLLLALLGAAMVLFSGAAVAQEELLPDLTVEKTGPSTAGPNDYVEYRFDVTNVGSGDAVLPSGAVLVRDELRTSGALRLSGGLGSGSCGSFAVQSGPVSPTRLVVECWNSESTDAIISPGGGPGYGFVSLQSPPASGGYIIDCATADPDNVIVESNESNNTDCVTTKIRR
jgi:hypothetical protein